MSNNKWILVYLDQYRTEINTLSLWENDINPLQHGFKIMAILHISGARAIFLLYFDHQYTES